MAVISPLATYSIAKASGFNEQQAVIMSAIAGGESGYDTTVINDKNSNGTIDVGLWQINSVHGYSTEAMKDPNQNGDAAKKIFDSQGFRAWYVYRDGKHTRYLAGAKTGQDTGVVRGTPTVSGVDAGLQKVGSVADPIADAVKGVVAPFAGIAQIGANLADGEWWKRVGLGAAGIGVAMIGLILLLSTSDVAKAAANVVPIGRAAGAIKKVVK